MLLLLKNILSFKCPRCHQGELFAFKWYDLKNSNKMHSNCSVCQQRTELEPGFYHGTGYVSYALTVGFSIVTFILWELITGYTFKNKELFWWLPLNISALILMQPWLMRLSRVIWLTAFYSGDDQFHLTKIQNK
jgi:uncharacterized protein (DUF983 family)